jgi:hypothetical protein
MPGIDEYIVSELMHRCTADLHAPSSVATRIIGQHRRRQRRNRALGVVVTGAAAGTAFTVVASAPGSAPRSAAGGTANLSSTAPALGLTATQTALYRLSAAAAAAPRPTGRYVVLTEKQDNYDRTSVLDSLTGDVWTYQHGAGVPRELPVARHDSPTEAAFDAMPTEPSALRRVLLTQARQQTAQAIAEEERMMAAHGKKGGIPRPRLSDDDYVFEQATTMLWNPLVGPALRSALYKILAATPGVSVTAASDMIGRPAIKISRYDSVAGVNDETFQNPSTGAVLETAFSYPRSKTRGTDLYLSVTSSATLPANPYGN